MPKTARGRNTARREADAQGEREKQTHTWSTIVLSCEVRKDVRLQFKLTGFAAVMLPVNHSNTVVSSMSRVNTMSTCMGGNVNTIRRCQT